MILARRKLCIIFSVTRSRWSRPSSWARSSRIERPPGGSPSGQSSSWVRPSPSPRKAIKSQALADYVVEWTDTQLPPAQFQAELWTMYFDGSLMKTGARAGLLFISPLGIHMRYVIRIHFTASNNVAKYEALINGLKITIELGVRRLDVRCDSQLVID